MRHKFIAKLILHCCKNPLILEKEQINSEPHTSTLREKKTKKTQAGQRSTGAIKNSYLHAG